MVQAVRSVIISCPSCGKKNRIVEQSGLPCCGNCHFHLSPLPPLKPEELQWTAFITSMRCNWKVTIVASYKYVRSLCNYINARLEYIKAERRFLALEEERKLKALKKQQREEGERRCQELERQRKAEEERRRKEEEQRAIEEWIAMHRRLQFDQLDHLSGIEFEKRLVVFFRHKGYSVEHTKGSGDQGADLILINGEVRIAVQAKRYTGRVGNGAIQELLGGLHFYNCSRGIVVTNSEFTRSAKELATKTKCVELWGRRELRDHYLRTFPCETPIFSWEAYRKLKASVRQ
jgi:restriction endonuclease Mrr